MPARLIAVAVPVPALGLLTYQVPGSEPLPPPGARVVVPLGHRTLVGIVVSDAEPPAAGVALKDIREVLDEGAFVPADVMALTQWVSEHYLAGPGATLAVALPPGGWSSPRAGRADGFKTVRVVGITAAGLDVAARLLAAARGAEPDRDLPRLGPKQREALALLAGAPEGWPAPRLAERGIPASALSRLRTLGLIAVRQVRVDRDPFATAVAEPAAAARGLTDDQQAALDRLRPHVAGAFHVALVHGVTGSGKTELYLRLAEATRAAGRGVLMLVPEIALTPQVAGLFRARFGAQVAIQHSGLSDGERHDQWHRIRRGDVDVVVGTRSAVFAPLSRPGLIVVDEEHDTSYKQEETPRYHGRDVAIMRGKFANALVVLGSATPSMEAYARAADGRYTLVALDRRVLDRPLARVRIVNMREEFATEGREVILSRALGDALEQRLAAKDQSLVLLNRRGFATTVLCRQCGSTVECPNCSVNLTVHTRGEARPGLARCHYCNFSRLVPKTCPNCAAPYMEHLGFGTERVEAEVAARLPGARLARVDRDTIRRRGSLADLLGRFARREIDVLIGTQMIAKGHDFPDVTLVGVISADVGLGQADFRSSERTFQLLTQVSGRAGRGEREGEAIIQTMFPGHYAIRMATAQDYRAFYEKEIAFRRGMRYPPLFAMVNVVVRGRTFAQAMDDARGLAERTREGRGGFALLGPAPAPLTRLRGEHRAQFFLKGTNRRVMREAVKAALDASPQLARRVSVDVDPVSML